MKKDEIVSANRYRHEREYSFLLIKSKGEDYEVTIDKIFHNKVKKHRWFLSSKKYAVAYINGKQELLHRFITNPPNNKYVDHINHNTLDNRIANLRVCTQVENMRNARLKKNNTSGHAGVYKHNQNDTWVAKIKVNYKSIYLGSFTNKSDAIKAREEAEVTYFGEFRYKGAKSKEEIYAYMGND